MKPFKPILLPLFALSIFCSCNNASDSDKVKSDSSSTVVKKIDSVALKSTGIYSGFVPCTDCEGIATYLSLKPDMTYRIEETHKGKKDSAVVTNGDWTFENGKISLVENGKSRVSYLAQSDRLVQLGLEDKPIGGNLGDKFILTRNEVANNPTWKDKKAAGVHFVGLGNEPFWSLEVDKNKGVTFNTPEMKTPVQVTYSDPTVTSNTRNYHLQTGNIVLDVIISQQFCSDGMSDFIYDYKVEVEYKGRKYSGCGSMLNPL